MRILTIVWVSLQSLMYLFIAGFGSFFLVVLGLIAWLPVMSFARLAGVIGGFRGPMLFIGYVVPRWAWLVGRTVGLGDDSVLERHPFGEDTLGWMDLVDLIP